MDVTQHRVDDDPSEGWSAFELRQYTLHRGRRSTLVELFDRELVEPQEAAGMWVVGQFRDLDRDDRLVWVRGFRDMTARAGALTEFYGGPVWREHRDAANATMVDSDDVLLLRPAYRGSGFPTPHRPRPPAAAPGPPPASIVTATLYHRETPVDAAFVELFRNRVQPALADAGARPLACLEVEPAENTYPALPVRTGEHVLVWFSSFADAGDHRAHTERLKRSRHWRDDVLPDLLARLSGPPRQLRLAPTARSLLR
jgi:hypothetical protein